MRGQERDFVASGQRSETGGKRCISGGLLKSKTVVHGELKPFSLHFESFPKIYNAPKCFGISGLFQMNENFFILRP